ncbi:MAG: hypothetical protein ABR606_05605 [Vicinamibacterales bacterium]
MQLRRARLCHDCEEVHDAQQCPTCASETFTFITRWVPVPERRARAVPTTSPEAEVYRQLISESSAPTSARLIKQAIIGATTLGLAGWMWQRSKAQMQKDDSGAPDDGSETGEGT